MLLFYTVLMGNGFMRGNFPWPFSVQLGRRRFGHCGPWWAMVGHGGQGSSPGQSIPRLSSSTHGNWQKLPMSP